MKHLKIEQSTTSAESVTKEQLSRLNEIVKGSTLDSSSNLKGKLTAPTAYIQDVEELTERFSDLTINVTGNRYVRFDDAEVKRLLLTKTWDTDGDGDFTVEELAAVTGTYAFGNLFKNNATMESFNELKYFTGLTTLPVESSTGVFYNCTSLQSVRLPQSITTINSAFNGCTSLSDVGDISQLTEISGAAFRKCPITNDINLPNLTVIGSQAFQEAGIKKIISLGAITSLSGISSTNAPFLMCKSLTEVNLPSTLINIGPYSFYQNTALVKVIGGENVETIGSYVFAQCSSLEQDVNFPKLAQLGIGAFERSGIKKVINLGRIEGLMNATNNVSYGEFSQCTSLESVNLPSTCKRIGWNSFYGDSALTTVNGLENVNYIGVQALYRCTSLEIDLNVPLLETIGSHAFFGSGIRSISNLGQLETIPDGASAGQGVFNTCTKLETVKLPSTLATVGAFAFYNCTTLQRIDIPEGVVTLGQQVFRGCSSIEGISFPSSIASIGHTLLYGCNKMQMVIFKGTTPPAPLTSGSLIWYNSNTGMHANLKFYVPDSAVDAYKNCGLFYSGHVNRVVGYSELWNASYIPECIVDFYDKITGDGTAYLDLGMQFETGKTYNFSATCQASGDSRFALGYATGYNSGGNFTSVWRGNGINYNGSAAFYIGELSSTELREVTMSSTTSTVTTKLGDNAPVTTNGTIGSGDITLFAGGSRRDQAIAIKGYTMGYFKVYDSSSNLIHDLRPGMLAGVPGMYDKVAHRFYKNSNTSGSFTVSND